MKKQSTAAAENSAIQRQVDAELKAGRVKLKAGRVTQSRQHRHGQV